jgi:uncharacterized membrane protein
MKFKLEMIVNKPRAEVWKLFTDNENISKWQPSLVNIETLNGTPGQVGTISKLTYKEREREFSLTQKIIQRAGPHRFDELYENDFADNTIQNKFIEQSQEKTLWVTETEYKFKTLVMKVMGNLMRKNFIRRSQREMERFKEMVESS